MALPREAQVDEVKDLVARGKEAGFLTSEEVGAALAAAELPPESMDAVLRLISDEGIQIVDSTDDLPPAARAARLREWSDRFVAGLHGARVDDPLLPAVLHTIERFDMDRADFASFLRSMAMDLEVTEYADYDDLLGYMAGSAVAIGTMMLPVLEPLPGREASAREPARQLGLAFQLTNFLRDVGED